MFSRPEIGSSGNIPPLMSQPFPDSSSVVSDPALVDAELSRLAPELNRGIFWDAALAARDYFDTLTPNNPSFSYPHVTGTIVRILRDHLAPAFTRDLLHQVPVTTNHSRRFTILVMRGTQDTGNPKGSPNSHLHRGEGTAKIFRDQYPHQFSLPGLEVSSPALKVLLYHIDRQTGEIGLELSDPADLYEVGDGNYLFTDWRHRIMLPPYSPEEPGVGWTPTIEANDLGGLGRRAESA